jgi:hypothetical protein
VGGRALLAFRGLERDESGAFTDEAELGADLELQYQSAVVNIDRNLTAYLDALAKAGRKLKDG